MYSDYKAEWKATVRLGCKGLLFDKYILLNIGVIQPNANEINFKTHFVILTFQSQRII